MDKLPKEENHNLVNGTDKYSDGVIEAFKQSTFQDCEEEFVFKKENLHIFISKIVCRDLSYSYQEEES